MNQATRGHIRRRAGNRCEYCGLLQEDSPLAALHVEHIIPRNTAVGTMRTISPWPASTAIFHKGSNLTGIDPDSGQIVVIFHPRRDVWDDHFEWRGIHLYGKTAPGRATIRVLIMNSEDQLALRSS